VCVAYDYTNQIKDILRGIKQETVNMTKELYKINEQQDDLLHIIEGQKFNAVEGYKLAKMIKDLREKRRKLKNEIQTLEMIQYNLTNGINDRIEKVTQSILDVREAQIKNKKESNYKLKVLPTQNLKELLMV